MRLRCMGPALLVIGAALAQSNQRQANPPTTAQSQTELQNRLQQVMQQLQQRRQQRRQEAKEMQRQVQQMRQEQQQMHQPLAQRSRSISETFRPPKNTGAVRLLLHSALHNLYY